MVSCCDCCDKPSVVIGYSLLKYPESTIHQLRPFRQGTGYPATRYRWLYECSRHQLLRASQLRTNSLSRVSPSAGLFVSLPFASLQYLRLSGSSPCIGEPMVTYASYTAHQPPLNDSKIRRILAGSHVTQVLKLNKHRKTSFHILQHHTDNCSVTMDQDLA